MAANHVSDKSLGFQRFSKRIRGKKEWFCLVEDTTDWHESVMVQAPRITGLRRESKVYASADILIFGHDAALLETRRLVLKTAGFRVWTASTASDAIEWMAKEPIDLFVLCQPLSSEECEGALLVAHSLRPDMRSLDMANRSLGCPAGERHAFSNVFLDPKDLISLIRDTIDFDNHAGTKH